jgi:hypothetical protein|tara:strand:+ start:2247 stop:2807 length:561 start_codon:yes stop_codon:yes gene_type:complete
MKKATIILIALSLTATISAQSIFERFADSDDVSLVSISPKMFKMLGQLSISSDDLEAKEYLDMVSSINNFKVLISGNDKVTAEMSKWVAKEVSTNDLEELMTVKDTEADIAFYIKDGKSVDRVEKLLMYVNGNSYESLNSLEGRSVEAILLLIEGDIDLNKISKLTDQMDLPGGKQLRKAKQKKIL